MSEFTLDIERIRQSARLNLKDGALVEGYRANKDEIISMLRASLATEWICFLRYTQHQLAADGINAETIAEHFGKHAEQERDHAMKIARRMKQLNENPSLDPSHFREDSHSEYKECSSLSDMIRENLIAERIAINSYSEMIQHIGDTDPTTRRLFEEILAKEEEHADEMASLLAAVDPREKLN